MMRWLRRLLLLGLLGGGGYAGYTAWKRKASEGTTGTPSWPPFEATSTVAPSTATPRTADATRPFVSAPPRAERAAAEPAASATDSPRSTHWVAPIDGQCPDGYPVKANDNSGIFHVVGGRFYVRTIPERCYANAADAVADGYRPAKA
jgi:hypothetical protein